MTRLGRTVAGVAVAALVTAAIGYASRAPYRPDGADSAVLRLSWRLRGEKNEVCRDRTQAELDALPVHMRTPQVCTGQMVSYRLVVDIDGAVDTVIYQPAGAKRDRAVFVLRDIPLAQGDRKVAVSFSTTEQLASAKQKPLHFESVIDARPGEITLITLDNTATRLMIRR